MRTTVTIDDDVFQAVQAQAETSGKRLGEVLSHVARIGLKAGAPMAKVRGLPVFVVPADSAVIPSSRARDMLADEGL